MQAQDTVNGWLVEIGELEGVPMSLEENGVCSLEYQDDLECNIELGETGEWLYLHSPLLECPDYDREDLFQQLLEMNLYTMDTNGGALGYCDRTNSIVLSRRFQVESLDGVQFRTELEEFVASAERLRGELTVEVRDSGDSGPRNYNAIRDVLTGAGEEPLRGDEESGGEEPGASGGFIRV